MSAFASANVRLSTVERVIEAPFLPLAIASSRWLGGRSNVLDHGGGGCAAHHPTSDGSPSIIATAKLSSASATTAAFELPPRPRRLYLDTPGGDCVVAPGPMHLAAKVDTRGLGAPAPDEVRWTSDVQGDLGSGYAVAPALRAGEHTVTVTAPDGLGGMLSERAIIVVGGRPPRSMSG